MKYRIGDVILLKGEITDFDLTDNHVRIIGNDFDLYINEGTIFALVKRGKKPAKAARAEPAQVEAADKAWNKLPDSPRDVMAKLSDGREIKGWYGAHQSLFRGWHIYDRANPLWQNNEADHLVIAWREMEG